MSVIGFLFSDPKKIRPELLPARFPYGARCTSDRAAIGHYIVTTVGAVKLPVAAPQVRQRARQWRWALDAGHCICQNRAPMRAERAEATDTKEARANSGGLEVESEVARQATKDTWLYRTNCSRCFAVVSAAFHNRRYDPRMDH
jgi:hypothetical protein